LRTVPTDRPTVSCEHGRRAAAPYRLRKRTPGRHAARAHVSPDDGGDGDARVLRRCLLPAESARVTNDDDGPVAATLRRRCVVEKGRGDGKNVAGARRIFPISARRVVLLIIIPANNEIREKGLGRVFSLPRRVPVTWAFRLRPPPSHLITEPRARNRRVYRTTGFPVFNYRFRNSDDRVRIPSMATGNILTRVADQLVSLLSHRIDRGTIPPNCLPAASVRDGIARDRFRSRMTMIPSPPP